MLSSTELDRKVHVYTSFLDEARPPTHEDTAAALNIAVDEAAASYVRLADQRVLVLAPGTLDIWMANPLSAWPTPFTVATDRGTYWGACIWDAFGIPAMLHEDALISTFCADCHEPLELRVTDGDLEPAEGVAHFAVPARRWWENIGYT